MSTDKNATIVKFSQTYPPELAAMIPPQFNAPDIIDNDIPDVVGPEETFDPTTMHKKSLWDQKLIQLKDVPAEDWWANAGKMLMVNRSGRPSSVGEYNIEFAYPDRLETPRAFSIIGDGTAQPVDFNGTQEVVLELTDVSAAQLKTARDFSLTGDIVAEVVSFNGTAQVVLQTSYNNVVPDDKLPVWISNSFTAINNRIDNLGLELGTFAPRTVVTSSGAGITLNASHKDKYIRLVNSGGVTVPPGVFVPNDVVYFRAAAGAVSINPGAGVTINAPYGQNRTLPGTGATAAIICVSTGVFDLIGSTQYV